MCVCVLMLLRCPNFDVCTFLQEDLQDDDEQAVVRHDASAANDNYDEVCAWVIRLGTRWPTKCSVSIICQRSQCRHNLNPADNSTMLL